MLRELEKRLQSLERRRVFDNLVEPGADATEIERYAFRVRQCAARAGRAMTQDQALRLADSAFAALAEMDRRTQPENSVESI